MRGAQQAYASGVGRNCAVLCFAAALKLLAQGPEDKTARLEGTVVDSVTGQPVKKAAVLLRKGAAASEGFAVVTDAGGHFEFSGLSPGDWIAEVHRAGYATLGSFEEAGTKETHWTLDPGGVIKDVKLRLTPAGVITGRVLDTDGEPLPSANVRLSPAAAGKDQRQLSFAQTNDLGEYRLFNIVPGKYTVSASYEPEWKQNFLRPVTKVETAGKEAAREDYVTTYYPGTADQSQAGAGALVSGIDIRLARGGVVRVRGRVAGASGPLAMVSLMQVEGRPPSVARNDIAIAQQDGSFAFDNVRPGRYLLECSAGFESSTGRLRGRQWIEVGSADVEGLQIVVNPSQKIEGKVSVEANARLPEGLHAVLVPREQDPTHQGAGLTMLRPDGTFTFDSVFEGRYDLALAKFRGEPDDFYVKSIRFGDDEALSAGLDVRGAESGKIEIVLRDDGGTISCQVNSENGEPASSAKVMAVPAGPQRHALALHGQATAGDRGECKLQGMAPGTYYVFAFEGQQEFSLHDDETWRRIEKFAAKAEVAARGTTAVDVKLMPANAAEQ